MAIRANTRAGATGLPAVLGGRYRLHALLGQGTRARVYAADDVLLGRQVAVKVFRDHAGTAGGLRQQEAEARLVASLNHYALTSLFDAGVTTTVAGDPQLYLVMEQVPAGTLRQDLQINGGWNPFRAGWLAYDLSDGLDYLHRAGYVHGDISPTNVLLDRRGNLRPLLGKLADFGIASIAGGAPSGSHTASSPTYLAPERVEGGPATPASDYYSLGLVLLETFTGRIEYPGDSATSARERLRRDPFVPDEIPDLLASMLTGMTARDPESRLGHTGVFDAVQPYLVSQQLAARGVTAESLRPRRVPAATPARRPTILDSPADATHPGKARIAAALLEAPIAAVLTRPIEDPAAPLTQHGWDEHLLDPTSALTPAAGNRPWLIPDALEHPAARHDPLVIDGPRIRAATGLPLTTRDGTDLGALVVLDTHPRTWTPEQLTALTDLAGEIIHEAELRRAIQRARHSRT